MKKYIRVAAAAAAILGCCCRTPAIGDDPATKLPNVVLIFADDLGYGDLGCFGGAHATPNIDRLAAEGARLTDFYTAQPVCSASRAALMTGRYPHRLGILGALGPKSQHGIPDGETTLAELLHARGYATAIFGKWHLGHHPQFLPSRHGFDDWFGLPYSNDMWPKHPERGNAFPDLPLFDGDAIREYNPPQERLTAEYTARAVQFIRQHRERPFFLYVPHTMPHVPLAAGEGFAGSTGRGLYADVISEVDASVGRILDTLEEVGVDGNTLLMFTSDNGPWISYGDHAGATGNLREGKMTTFEGGVRIPFLARFPGRIPALHVSPEPAMTIDVLPTVARLVGADSPDVDGLDIWPLLSGTQDVASPHEALLFYWNEELQAVRSGQWKLHLPHAYRALVAPGAGGQPGQMEERRIEKSLFDLVADPGETQNVLGQHPEIVERMDKLLAGR